ncbi:MAG TPA: hypothetical protein IAC89_01470 [Candidatus Aphodousia faecalis]|nr:hypothetical protein [Candidatus Aphodousia faecalis]
MLDLSFLMDDPDFCSSCTLQSSRITGDDHGRPTYEKTEKRIIAVVQPATAEDMQRLAETAGGVTTETLAIYTKEKLCAGDPKNGADMIVFEGQVYEVCQVEDFMPNGNYCRSLMRRVSNDD